MERVVDIACGSHTAAFHVDDVLVDCDDCHVEEVGNVCNVWKSRRIELGNDVHCCKHEPQGRQSSGRLTMHANGEVKSDCNQVDGNGAEWSDVDGSCALCGELRCQRPRLCIAVSNSGRPVLPGAGSVVHDNVHSNVHDNVYDNVHANVHDNLHDNVRSNVPLSIATPQRAVDSRHCEQPCVQYCDELDTQ